MIADLQFFYKQSDNFDWLIFIFKKSKESL